MGYIGKLDRYKAKVIGTAFPTPHDNMEQVFWKQPGEKSKIVMWIPWFQKSD